MPEVDFKVASRITAAIIPSYTRTTSDVQPLGPATDTSKVTHYRFAHLEQRQLGLTLRFHYPFTASMTLQANAQPSVSTSPFCAVHELSATPAAAAFAIP